MMFKVEVLGNLSRIADLDESGGLSEQSAHKKSIGEGYSILPPAEFETPLEASQFLLEKIEGLVEVDKNHFCRSWEVNDLTGESHFRKWCPVKSYRIVRAYA